MAGLVEILRSNPTAKARFDAATPQQKQAIARVVFRQSVEPQLRSRRVSDDELATIQEKFVERFSGGSTTPIETPEVKSTGGAGTVFATGLVKGARNITGVAGLAPNAVSEYFGKGAEAGEEVTQDYRADNPIKSFATEVAGELVPGLALGRVVKAAGKLVGLGKLAAKSKPALAAIKVAKASTEALPFSSTPTDLAINTAGDVAIRGLHKVWVSRFGKKTGGAITQAAAQSGSTTAQSVRDAEYRAVLKEFGLEDSTKTVTQLTQELPPDKIKSFSTKMNELDAAKNAAAVTARDAAKAAKAGQAIDSKPLTLDKEARKRLGAFVKQFGREVSPDEQSALIKGGDEAKEVFEAAAKQKLVDEQIAKQTEIVRSKLLAKRTTELAKNKTMSQASLANTIKELSGMSFDDMTKELADREAAAAAQVAAKKASTATSSQAAGPPLGPPSPNSAAPTIVESVAKAEPTVQEVIAPVVEHRPDVAKAVETAQTVVSQTAQDVTKGVKWIIGKTEQTLLSPEELASPNAKELALGRARVKMKDSIQEQYANDPSKIKDLQEQATKQIERLKAFLDDQIKTVASAGTKGGRPTTEQAAAVPASVRLAQRRAREAAALAEKRASGEIATEVKPVAGTTERGGVKDTGPNAAVIEAEKLNAAKAARTAQADPHVEFERMFKRKPNETEQILMDGGDSPGSAVDQEFQIEYENAHPELFGD